MRRKASCVARLVILNICASLLLSGCWNARELDHLAIVTAIGIDSNDGQYEVSVQIVDPSSFRKDSAMERSPTKVYTESDHSLFEVIRKLTTQSSRKLYLAHMRFVIFDEETARRGIKEPLDQLFRDHEVRPDFKLAIVRNRKAKDALEYISPTEAQPIMDMIRSLQTSEKFWAPTSAVEVKDLMQRFSNNGIEPIMTGMILKGDIPKGETLENVKRPESFSNFEFIGIGVFRDDRLIGWLNESESKAFTYILNKVNSTVGLVSCPNSEGSFIAEVSKARVDMIPRIVDHRPHMTLKASLEGNIGEVLCDFDLADQSNIRLFEQAASEQTEKTLLNGVKAAQSLQSDIFGFGEAFHRRYPKQWRQWKDDWHVKFSEMTVEIDARMELRHFGKIIRPFENTTVKE